MKSFDLFRSELMMIVKRACPHMTMDEIGRYVIGLTSGVGHVLRHMQIKAGDTPDSFYMVPPGYDVCNSSVVLADDLIWDVNNRCWEKAPTSMIGQSWTAGVARLRNKFVVDVRG